MPARFAAGAAAGDGNAKCAQSALSYGGVEIEAMKKPCVYGVAIFGVSRAGGCTSNNLRKLRNNLSSF